MLTLFGKSRLRKEHRKLAADLNTMAKQILETKKVYAASFSKDSTEVETWTKLLQQIQRHVEYLDSNPDAVLPWHEVKPLQNMHYELSMMVNDNKLKR